MKGLDSSRQIENDAENHLLPWKGRLFNDYSSYLFGFVGSDSLHLHMSKSKRKGATTKQNLEDSAHLRCPSFNMAPKNDGFQQ